MLGKGPRKQIVKYRESQCTLKRLIMRRNRYKLIVFALVLVYVYHFFGVGDYVQSKNFDSDFNYPLNVDIRPIVQAILDGQKPNVKPINYYPYKFLSNYRQCSVVNKPDLVIIVKSAIDHFGHRDAIRKTYGKPHVQGYNVKTFFFLGVDNASSDVQKNITKEMTEFKDIIQMSFRDSYFNNTIKTVMSFRWIFQHCAEAQHYLFTDDDMYISVQNLLKYVSDVTTASERDGILFAGYVFKSAPQRFRSSKWRVSLEEYPWDKWPPYVTAGAYVVSNKAMKMLYVGSLFVKHFRFDDIYLGIVAKKMGIVPTHCPHFHFYKKPYEREVYSDVIASHGYSNHDELIRVWNEQNAL
uniref:Hexosyltransferase n=1 Tax=Bombyx mori TaxID=7091 RepID=A0A8R2M1U4_BOMMO|nr:beta-1,3-galactosyltransferase isoform X2 [Bombyx mori]